MVKADEEAKRKQKEEGVQRDSSDGAVNRPKRVLSGAEDRSKDSYGQIKDKDGQTHEDRIADEAA